MYLARPMKLMALPVVVVAALAVACGGGGEEEDSSGLPTVTPRGEATTQSKPSPTATFTPEPARSRFGIGTATPEVFPTPTATTLPTPAETATPPIPTPTPSNPTLARARALVLASEELNVPVSEIKVLSMDPETWPTTGLGCESPGEIYAQVLVPGWKIIVNAGGVTAEYHTDGLGERAVSCTAAALASGSPSINVVQEAGLSGVTSIIISARPPNSDPVEFVRIEEPSEIEIVLDALSESTHLAEPIDCAPLFQADFVMAQGTESILYACPGEGQLLRGAQAFWNGQDGIAPPGFQQLINAALAAREFPAFPPEP